MATVSRVMNGHPDVSLPTRSEVMRFARKLGYVSNRASTTADTSSKRTRLIALAVPEMRGDYVTQIVTGAAESLRDRNAHLVICSVGSGSQHTDPLQDRLLLGTTGGALLVLPSEDNGDLLALRNSGYPFVVVEPAMPVDETIPTVSVTNWAGAKMAAEYLIGLGHTHLGIITGPMHLGVNGDRLAGYQAALLSRGLPLVPKLVQQAETTIDGGREAANRLLSLPHAPSAILGLDDNLAVGVLRAAQGHGMNVPRDLSVVGFGNTEIASVTTPSLTTIQQPLQGLGRVGADMLWRLLQGQQLDAPRMELSTTLVERESAARPRGASFLTM